MNQASVDYFSQKVEELIHGIDNGDLYSDIIPDKYTWEHLLGLFFLRKSLDGAEALFEQIYDLAIRSGEKYFKQKVKSGRKIKVVFQAVSAAQWPAEETYRTFKARTDMETKVLVTPLFDRDKESSLYSYQKTLEWFEGNGYDILEGMDSTTREAADWEKFGDFPDVVYQLNSWFGSIPSSLWFAKLPLRCLVAYIPYGFYLADNWDGTFADQAIYNKEIMNLMWRVYTDSAYNLEGYRKYQLLHGKNVRFSGYAKMDYFYKQRSWKEDDIKELWRIPDGKKASEFGKVIIAPHYSVGNKGEILFSTFRWNAWFYLYLAKKYQDSVSFIFKPHPNLRHSAVEQGLFSSYEDYDEYLRCWEKMPNCRVVEEAGYLDYFATSDAMIMDSGSFLAEYLYTGKPLLFLTRAEQFFLEIGKRVVSSYYKTSGGDYAGIESFLTDVVLEGKDTMKEKRMDTFEREFDYKKINNSLASDYICNEVFRLMDATE